MRSRRWVGAVVAALVVMLLVTGCETLPPEDPDSLRNLKVDEVTVQAKGAQTLDAYIEMVTGELKLGAQSADAMTGTFTYAPNTWAPEVDYSVEGTAGALRVTQPLLNTGPAKTVELNSTWDMQLSRDMPLEVDMKLGATKSRIDFKDTDLRYLHVLAGVGESEIDLSGTRTNDSEIDLESAVGRMTVYVPEDTGVRVKTASVGIGDFTPKGLQEENGAWVNDAYATSEIKMNISVRRGIGEVKVIVVK